jgi:hypothetical protein
VLKNDTDNIPNVMLRISKTTSTSISENPAWSFLLPITEIGVKTGTSGFIVCSKAKDLDFCSRAWI